MPGKERKKTIRVMRGESLSSIETPSQADIIRRNVVKRRFREQKGEKQKGETT